MGCCFSTAAAAADQPDRISGKVSSTCEKDKTTPLLPPAVVEEETVKEVLSETTLLASSNENPTIDHKTQKPVVAKTQEDDEEPDILKVGRAHVLTRPDLIDPIENPENGSEVSEICSLSVSESVSSTVVNALDEDDEVKQKKMQGIRQRSPAKSQTRVPINNHPTRRTSQSPAKRNVGGGGSVRLVHPGPGRRSGSGFIDPAERSGRRSRSPATNRSAMSPGPATGSGVRKKNSESPGRVRSVPSKSESEQVSQWPSSGTPAGNYNSATRESLENPLVSLECFIFL